MEKFTLRPATREDVDALGDPLPFRARAKAAEVNGELIGVGGLGYPSDGTVVAFARLTGEMRRRKVQLHKTALALLSEARAAGVRRIVATADPEVPVAPAWLERLGFRPVGDAFVWGGP